METVLGIDLGTTNSVVAVYRNGRAEVLREDGEALLPSVVGLDDRGQIIVGTPARNQAVLAPDRTVRSIKRQMGQDVRVRLGDREFTPQEISATILRRLKERAENVLGHPVGKAVITVPAFFNEVQREATRQAGELAGLEVVRIINEPTAAALAYDPQPSGRERLLVYDLGGGTFDVSVVQIERGVVEVLASHGDTHLGGDDFDQALLDYVCDRFQEEHKIDLRAELASRARVLRAVEDAKKVLSFEPLATIEEEFIAETAGVPLHLRMEIRREEYEALIGPWLERTLSSVDQAIAAAQLHAQQIDRVVLMGGVTRTPLVQSLLDERLRQPLHLEINPDLGVALGAAIQGGMIAGEDVGPVLVDITPHTLGIAALGYMHGLYSQHSFSPIIPRNTPLPASRAELYTTAVDGQKQVLISVFQGEDEDSRRNEHVGEFLLEGLADVDRGNELLVRFDLDLDGILKVSAIERATGKAKALVIDNAARRFRQTQAALFDEAPAPPTFEYDAAEPPAWQPAGEAVGDSSENVEARKRAEELLARSRRLLEGARPQDAEDLSRTIVEIETALAERDGLKLVRLTAELEDLVFYLQDA